MSLYQWENKSNITYILQWSVICSRAAYHLCHSCHWFITYCLHSESYIYMGITHTCTHTCMLDFLTTQINIWLRLFL